MTIRPAQANLSRVPSATTGTGRDRSFTMLPKVPRQSSQLRYGAPNDAIPNLQLKQMPKTPAKPSKKSLFSSKDMLRQLKNKLSKVPEAIPPKRRSPKTAQKSARSKTDISVSSINDTSVEYQPFRGSYMNPTISSGKKKQQRNARAVEINLEKSIEHDQNSDIKEVFNSTSSYKVDIKSPSTSIKASPNFGISTSEKKTPSKGSIFKKRRLKKSSTKTKLKKHVEVSGTPQKRAFESNKISMEDTDS